MTRINLGNMTPTKLSINIDDNPATATGLITSDNTQPDADGTLTIGSHEYVFKSALTGAAEEVLIETDANTTLANLKDLVNSGRAAVAATGVLTSDETNVTAADTVVIGDETYTFVDTLTEVASTGVLTSDETNVAAGETVVIGTTTYTFVTALSGNTPNQVVIGATADDSLTNLARAINREAAYADISYSYSTVAHPTVTSSAVAAHAITVTAQTVGVAGDLIASTDTSSHLSWGDTTLGSGADAVANEVFIGADAASTLTNLVAAINGASGEGTLYSTGTVANADVTAVATGEFEVTVTAVEAGTAGNELAKTESSSHLDWDGTGEVLSGGVTATAANDEATATTLNTTNHTLLIEAIPVGVLGNAVVFSVTATHLSLSGSNVLGGTTAGGSTIGTSTVGGEGGLIRVIISVCPQLSGSPTYTISLVDADGDTYYTSGALNENATTRTALEQMIAPDDTIKITTSAKVEESLPVVIYLR